MTFVNSVSCCCVPDRDWDRPRECICSTIVCCPDRSRRLCLGASLASEAVVAWRALISTCTSSSAFMMSVRVMTPVGLPSASCTQTWWRRLPTTVSNSVMIVSCGVTKTGVSERMLNSDRNCPTGSLSCAMNVSAPRPRMSDSLRLPTSAPLAGSRIARQVTYSVVVTITNARAVYAADHFLDHRRQRAMKRFRRRDALGHVFTEARAGDPELSERAQGVRPEVVVHEPRDIALRHDRVRRVADDRDQPVDVRLRAQHRDTVEDRRAPLHLNVRFLAEHEHLRGSGARAHEPPVSMGGGTGPGHCTCSIGVARNTLLSVSMPNDYQIRSIRTESSSNDQQETPCRP